MGTDRYPAAVTSSWPTAHVAPGPYALALQVRDAVVAYHEAISAPRLVDDEGSVAAAYGMLADATQLRLSPDEWTQRLLEDRIQELRARLDRVSERVGERRWWRPWRRDGVGAMVDHRTGARVIEVDVVVVEPSLAAACVVLVLGDEPFRLTDPCWWVYEHGRWAATECAVGPAAALEWGFPEQAEGDAHRFVLTDGGAWEEARRG